MNLRPNRLAATLAATGVTAALVLASPMGADAAKMITGKDIKNNSITSKDVKNGSLTAGDFAAGQVPTTGLTGPAGPAGKDGAPGKAAPQPTTIAVTGKITAASQASVSTQKLPAYVQVTGINFETTNYSPCSGGFGQITVEAGNGQIASANLGSSGPTNLTLSTAAVGPAGTAVTVSTYCFNPGSPTPPTPAAFDYKATLVYTAFDPTPSATITSEPAPQG